MEKKKVTIEQYSQVLNEHKDEVYDIPIKAWQVPILHGLITLAVGHPGIKGLSEAMQDLIEQARWWCREKFTEWGFTPEEVEYLDTMREKTQKKEGDYTLAVNAFEAGSIIGLILKEEEPKRAPLSGVYQQLVDIKKRIEEEGGVTKKILPGGMLQITDPDGNKIVREPYPWEIESN